MTSNVTLPAFEENYRSEQPVHPTRAFTGRDRVQQNWSKLFECIPDVRAELLRLAVVGDTEWGEWIWRGTKEDGTLLDERGVTIMAFAAAGSPGGRLYLEETEQEGDDIAETVRRIAGRQDDA